jgi:hypothetical protein
MAISEYVVIARQGSGKVPSGLRAWNGAATGGGIDDSNVRSAKYLIVEAESNAEAIRGVRQLYSGMIGEGCFVVKKSLGEEL